MNLLAYLKRKPRLATVAESRATMTLLSPDIHVHERSLDYNTCIFMRCNMTVHGMYSLYNGWILLLSLILFQTSALSLHLEHLESFPQALWVCAEKQLLTMLRGYSLWHLDPKPISQRPRVSLYFCQGRQRSYCRPNQAAIQGFTSPSQGRSLPQQWEAPEALVASAPT